MMGFLRFLLQLVIGAAVVFVGLAICCGGVEQAISLLFISVICTVGFSLLIWIPLCWFTGWLLVTVFTSLARALD